MYTVNVKDDDGSAANHAKSCGYHAYHANGVTAIETKANTKAEARRIARQFGKVLYVFA